MHCPTIHFSIKEDGRLTGLGIKGGLESYVSATGLKRTIMFMLAKYTDNSIFRKGYVKPVLVEDSFVEF